MNDGSKGYEDGHYYRMTKEEAQMSPMKYDPETNTFHESEGWRSRSCTMTLVDYIITLILIGWQLIAVAIAFVFFAIPLALVVIGVLALVGLI